MFPYTFVAMTFCVLFSYFNSALAQTKEKQKEQKTQKTQIVASMTQPFGMFTNTWDERSFLSLGLKHNDVLIQGEAQLPNPYLHARYGITCGKITHLWYDKNVTFIPLFRLWSDRKLDIGMYIDIQMFPEGFIRFMGSIDPENQTRHIGGGLGLSINTKRRKTFRPKKRKTIRCP